MDEGSCIHHLKQRENILWVSQIGLREKNGNIQGAYFGRGMSLGHPKSDNAKKWHILCELAQRRMLSQAGVLHR